jgi:serine/threonine protein kinase
VDIERLKEYKIPEITIAEEATVLASLTHPNIIMYYDSFSYEKYFCIITEYCNVIKESERKILFENLNISSILLEWLIGQVY